MALTRDQLIALARANAKASLNPSVAYSFEGEKLSADALSQGAFSAEEIAELQRMTETANRMKYCVIVISAAPMLAIYPWLQKYFAKGAMIGSVKG